MSFAVHDEGVRDYVEPVGRACEGWVLGLACDSARRAQLEPRQAHAAEDATERPSKEARSVIALCRLASPEAKYTWQVDGNVHSHTVVVCGSLRPLWATPWPEELEGGSLTIPRPRLYQFQHSHPSSGCLRCSDGYRRRCCRRQWEHRVCRRLGPQFSARQVRVPQS